MPAIQVPLPEPSQIRRRSSFLARGYASIRLRQESGLDRKLTVLRSSVGFLELLTVGAAVWEAASELGIQSWEALQTHRREWSELAEAFAGVIDFKRVIEEHREQLVRVPSGPPREEIGEFFDLMRRAADWVIRTCPIEDLLGIAEESGENNLGDRCRRAHSQLRAILLRTQIEQDHRFATAGRAYVEGRLTIEEISEFLDVPVSDALVQLEKYGWVRPLDTIRLDDATRAEILGRIREDRIRRGGEPEFDEELIRRDVIASQRIENVDARLWLTK